MENQENQSPQFPSSQNLNLQNPRKKSPEPNEKKSDELVLQSQNNHELEQFIEKIIGYSFRNRTLLMEAFTDSSLKEEDYSSSYERLEFFGDSVLNLLIAKNLYFCYPDLAPGQLTRLRAANTDKEKLARVALKYGLHRYLRHKKPLLSKRIEDFSEAIQGYPLHSSGLVDAPKVLADIVEALIGAIFIDTGFQMGATWQVVKKLLQPMISPTTLETHPVTKLHEICQKKGSKVKIVDLWKDRGEIEIYVDDEFAGKAKYITKRLIAINRAANNAYNKIAQQLSLVDTLEIMELIYK